eukprot:GHVU01072368.1.p1 GENE.GHVU01072368.1~~GHVU01072368.1.p1  ORF type:complete len:181 (+),score=28.49 GHVU01072368.1:108-650(+)
MMNETSGGIWDKVDSLWENNREWVLRNVFAGVDWFKNKEFVDDFTKFLERYTLHLKNTASSFSSSTSAGADRRRTEAANPLGLPEDYHRRYRVNFLVRWRQKFEDGQTDAKEQLRLALLYYVDFLQNQNFEKLIRLLESKQRLPIAAKRSEILDIVQRNPVVLIVGDTGCGKTTQVLMTH